MNNCHHDLLNPGSYVLSQDHYDNLCTIRDKLLLMAQLAGTATSSSDDHTMLFVRRALIGRLFGDMGFQIADVLDGLAKAEAHVRRARTQ